MTRIGFCRMSKSLEILLNMEFCIQCINFRLRGSVDSSFFRFAVWNLLFDSLTENQRMESDGRIVALLETAACYVAFEAEYQTLHGTTESAELRWLHLKVCRQRKHFLLSFKSVNNRNFKLLISEINLIS